MLLKKGYDKDKFPQGCPLNVDPVEMAHRMAEKGITLYCAGCEPGLMPSRKFFMALCLITGGQYVPLRNANNLTKLIIGNTREELSMEKMMAQVHDEVMKEAVEKGAKVDEDHLTKRIHQLFNSGSATSSPPYALNKLKDFETFEITDDIKSLSKLRRLSVVVAHAKLHGIELTKYAPDVEPSSFLHVPPFKLVKACKILKRRKAMKTRSLKLGLKLAKQVYTTTDYYISKDESANKTTRASTLLMGSYELKGIRRSSRLCNSRISKTDKRASKSKGSNLI